MVVVREAKIDEIPRFVEMEQAKGTAEFIIPYSLGDHLAKFNKQDIVYLSIIDEGRLAGFIILAIDPDGVSVEFRRIVVSAKNKGIGQSAIRAMEDYCRAKFRCKRIWLDVFEFNERGRYIYEKLGYTQFKKGKHDGKSLLYYQKSL